MSRINKMSLEQLFKGIEIILGQSDILFFCNDESVIYEYYRIFEDRQKRDLKTFLAQHEDKIDKEKLIFCLYLNFQDNLKIIKNRIEKLQESKNNFIELSRLQEKEKAQSKYMQKIFELGRDTDVYSLIRKSSSGNFETEVISSKEIFKNQRFSEKRKLQRWREIDKEIGEDGKGSIFIIQTLLLSDLGAILPSFEVGMAVRESILNNCALKREGITLTKLNSLRESNYQEYIDFIDSVQPDEYLPAFREEIIKNIRFIDIDKVFLMICSRIQDCLERGLYSEKQTELISQMMIYLRGKIEDKKKVLKGKLQDIETYEEQEVEYSYNDLEQCIKRCIGNTYIKKSEVSKTKTDLLEGNIFLRDLEVKIINLIPLEDDEIEQIMGYHTENFVYGVKKLGYQESKIIEKLSMYPNVVVPDLVSYLYEEGDITISGVTKLYNNQKIDAEFFKEFSEETDISSEVNLQKINEGYLKIKETEEPSEEQISNLDTIIEFYKIVNLDRKTQEELEEESNNVMYELAEDFEGEEDLLFYYEKGLLTLQTVAEWSGESLIDQLYKEEKIDLKDLERLEETGNISNSYVNSIYAEMLLDTNIGQKEKVDILIKRKFSIDVVEKLYMNMLIDKEDLKRLVANNIITEEQKNNIQDNLSLEKAEEISSIKFVIDDTVKKIKGEKTNNTAKKGNRKKERVIIDPEKREELFELLGFRKVKPERISEDSPFYNYDFYMLLGKDGKTHLNTPIIAERYYEDKKTETKYATENATYFFQYGDLMVLSNYTEKNEVVGKKENVVFRANHTIANKTRNGRWADDVIGNVIRTLLSSDLKDYNKGNQGLIILEKIKEIYTPEQIRKIFVLANEIDSGEYLYEIVKEKIELEEENVGFNIDDDDDAR